MDASGLQRLALIKYFAKVGREYADKPEPVHAFAILALHDAVELFLQLAADEYEVTNTDIRFMEYWDRLKGHVELTQKTSMARLNKARVNFKHHGILPSKQQVNEFAISVETFFLDNVKLVFDLDFEHIDLIDLVKNEETRNLLKEAVELSRQGKQQDAIEKVAIGFKLLVDEYEIRKRDGWHGSPYNFSEDLSWLRSPFINFDNLVTGDRRLKDGLKDFMDKVGESIRKMSEALKIVTLGIDYKRYARFSYLTPRIHRGHSLADDLLAVDKYIPEQTVNTVTQQDFEFCIDFVIEAALKLDEFDYTLEHP